MVIKNNCCVNNRRTSNIINKQDKPAEKTENVNRYLKYIKRNIYILRMA